MVKSKVTAETRLIQIDDATAESDAMLYSVDGSFLRYARTIENSLIEAGARVGDYTLLDLYSLAQPFALAESNKDKITLVQSI